MPSFATQDGRRWFTKGSYQNSIPMPRKCCVGLGNRKPKFRYVALAVVSPSSHTSLSRHRQSRLLSTRIGVLRMSAKMSLSRETAYDDSGHRDPGVASAFSIPLAVL